VLVGAAKPEEVVARCEGGIDLMTAGTPATRLFERLNNGGFDSMLADMRTRYDYIVVDAPPAVVAGDALVLANKTDASVLVVRANQDQRGLVARLVAQFREAHGELIGLVLNRPRGTAGGYFMKNYATMAGYAAKAG
jgi:Mrp family chromosome partitioning ATPase